MIILIPLGGVGARFSQLGYKQPKALIKVMGKSILFWLIDNLDVPKGTRIYIPYNKEYSNYRFEDLLRKQYPHYKFQFHCLQNNTGGAAETIYIALSQLTNIEDQCILCLDGDNFYTCDIVRQWNGENSVFTFKDEQDTPIYSYVENGLNSIITNIVEKEKISDYACTGAYGFSSWMNLKEKCKFILDNDIRQKGEFYTSTVVKEMLKEKVKIVNKVVERNDYICLGTPTQVRLFCHNYPLYNSYNNKCLISPKRYCFDFDNTLVTFPKISGDYSTVEPIDKNINLLRYLKRFGHTIIIYTARRMRTHGGNMGKLMKDIGKITFNTLDKFDIPYDEIYFGKPEADVYIDDLAMNCFDDLEKELGYYETMIKPRDFNTIRSDTMQVCIKESNDLSGEIYYYQNIPPEVKDMFPIMVDYKGNTCYSVEKVNGITVSNLYLSESLSEDQLIHVMNSIYRLQKCKVKDDIEVNILYNYYEKMSNRFKKYDYSKFNNFKETYDGICEGLKKYNGVKKIIHGDAVFTNILINDYGKIKFIDMRGNIGSTLTIHGDYLYDWAKLYQSLIGYDEIHEGKHISDKYKSKMIQCFYDRFVYFYGKQDWENLKTITKSLLFSLIPLHNNKKCIDYYALINSVYLKIC